MYFMPRNILLENMRFTWVLSLTKIELTGLHFARRNEGRKEGNVLFNDALNFFLKIYGYMVSDIV